MTTTTELDQRLQWMRDGEARLRGPLPSLSAASGLPGWTRAHVVAHLIGNAEALLRLVAWACTGVETPMYRSPASRAEQIARDHARPAEWLIDNLARRGDELLAAVGTLSAQQWDRPVRTAQGRLVTAAEIPWMRARESFVHLVDLAAGTGFADLPANFVDALLDDATAAVARRPGCPPLVLRPGDRDRTWSLAAAPDPGVATGSAATLLAWVTGRSRPVGLPPLPAWL